jgi:predicted nuclease of restriction endonuclease-like (RecB) superfamily
MLASYAGLLTDIKGRIQQAQTRAMLSVNAELARLYWDIGRLIVERQQREGWGAAVIPRLSRDLRNDLAEIKGFSERNIGRMIAFYRFYPQPAEFSPQAVAKMPTTPILPQVVAKLARGPKVPQAVAQLDGRAKVPRLAAPLAESLLWLIPWGHHAVLLEKVKGLAARLSYMEQTLANGWSRNVLTIMIESGAHARQGKAITNFDRLLPSPQSDLAQQTLKDPYIFDFLTLTEPLREPELETSLLLHVERFLLELGRGAPVVMSSIGAVEKR